MNQERYFSGPGVTPCAFAAVFAVAFTFTACLPVEETVSQDDYDALVLLSAASNVTNASAQLELNGVWASFTGNGTNEDTLRHISATNRGGLVAGVSQTDSGSFGGFSSCSFIVAFNNDANFMITRNPPFNGGCFAGDTNKGRYFKEIWIDGPTAGSYWTCTVNGAASTATLDEAIAVVDNTDKSNPGTGGCGGFAWSRIELRG